MTRRTWITSKFNPCPRGTPSASRTPTATRTPSPSRTKVAINHPTRFQHILLHQATPLNPINYSNLIKSIIQGFKSLTSAIMQSSDLKRNLLQEVVQDHGRGLTRIVCLWLLVSRRNHIHARILTLKTPVKLESTKQA